MGNERRNGMVPVQHPIAGYRSAAPSAPNAALLIDFDNVTTAIQDDLGKQLKALLNSPIIRGKVAVQRAYADWRRYPQYILPLAEASIDLIFAPAYGSAKKNATDLRLAVDAMELVFTRPEIGTFILVTGDSDFASLVLKLKEYGKYVIGVGMRESSSDLLIKSCDEYYSYHALTGLTRTEEVEGAKEDPWELVRRAVAQMVRDRDAMRVDRLKQVMLELDPGFDERALGYPKFSKFVQEAAQRGLLRVRRLEGGQYEIMPPEDAKGRRRREEGRTERSTRSAPVERAEAAAVDAPALGLAEAYEVLRAAVAALVGEEGWARDADVKRKMLELAPGFDEGRLGFTKFSRFLQRAHDAEVIELRRVNGGYEVTVRAHLTAAEAPAAMAALAEAVEASAAPAPPAEAAPALGATVPPGTVLRGLRRGVRAGGRPSVAAPPPILPEQVVPPTPAVEAPAAAAPAGAGAPAAGLPATPEDLRRWLTQVRGIGPKTARSLVERFGLELLDLLRQGGQALEGVLPPARLEALRAHYAASAAAEAPAAQVETSARGGGRRGRRGRRGGRSRAKRSASA